MAMNLSIVVTTCNRADLVGRLLESLKDQTDSNFQVIVAMDGCTDHTEKMLHQLRPGFDLKWVNTHCTGYGLAVARNRGILAADGEAVVILDDDNFPQTGFVAAHKQSVKRRVITGGPRHPADSSDRAQLAKMQELARLPPCQSMSFDSLLRKNSRLAFVEANICLYREDFIDMGLFSERLKLYGFIGQEFFARARYVGYEYQYNPDAGIVHHRQRDGDNGLSSKRKHRQIRMATALRQTLMHPLYYDAQIRWARCLADGRKDCDRLPPFWFRAGLAFPYRYSRGMARTLRKKYRSLIHS